MVKKAPVCPTSHLRIKGFVFIATMIFLSGCDVITSEAVPQFSNFQCNSDFRIVNEEPDAGWTASFTITNVGKPGNINIMPKLSTSEGEWVRDQTLYFGAGESRNLSYFFSEPTINAENPSCYANTIPPPV